MKMYTDNLHGTTRSYSHRYQFLQFVFVYHGDENAPSPPRCVMNDHNLDETVQETWDTAKCINIVK